ncbi:hypothetical protein cypCar_00040705 [Cyprinus carpio]|nr:hypothetical protein cypCar_00040705 [Cyprinus carpio]
MAGFWLLRLILAVAALIVCTAQRRLSPSVLHEKSGVVCLNGGTSLLSPSGRHMLCFCPDGFSGSNCERDESVSCFDGLGLQYRGPVSKSESGRECLEWDSESVRGIGAYPKNHGPGRHNYCRRVTLSEERRLTENTRMRTNRRWRA